MKKREKILLGGYEFWLDRDKLTIYDKKHSQHGMHFDVAGEGDNIYIISREMTDEEKKQMIGYLKQGR